MGNGVSFRFVVTPCDTTTVDTRASMRQDKKWHELKCRKSVVVTLRLAIWLTTRMVIMTVTVRHVQQTNERTNDDDEDNGNARQLWRHVNWSHKYRKVFYHRHIHVEW